jgi:hypothetical protein
MWDAEAFGEVTRSIDDRVGDGNEAATRISEVAGNMRKAGPVAGAENSDADRQGTPLLEWASVGKFTRPNVTEDFDARHTHMTH